MYQWDTKICLAPPLCVVNIGNDLYVWVKAHINFSNFIHL
jgi:hypothetical protein